MTGVANRTTQEPGRVEDVDAVVLGRGDGDSSGR